MSRVIKIIGKIYLFSIFNFLARTFKNLSITVHAIVYLFSLSNKILAFS